MDWLFFVQKSIWRERDVIDSLDVSMNRNKKMRESGTVKWHNCKKYKHEISQNTKRTLYNSIDADKKMC